MWIHLWEVDDRNARLAMEKLIQLDDNDISVTPKCEIIISDIAILASPCRVNADLLHLLVPIFLLMTKKNVFKGLNN